MIKYLIEHGANVNKVTEYFIPLIIACQYNYKEILG